MTLTRPLADIAASPESPSIPLVDYGSPQSPQPPLPTEGPIDNSGPMDDSGPIDNSDPIDVDYPREPKPLTETEKVLLTRHDIDIDATAAYRRTKHYSSVYDPVFVVATLGVEGDPLAIKQEMVEAGLTGQQVRPWRSRASGGSGHRVRGVQRSSPPATTSPCPVPGGDAALPAAFSSSVSTSLRRTMRLG
jgi:hypothetical protein